MLNDIVCYIYKYRHFENHSAYTKKLILFRGFFLNIILVEYEASDV